MKVQKIEGMETENLIITQANALALSAYQMTLQEKRLLLLAISLVRLDDTSFLTYRIPVSELMVHLEIKYKDFYQQIDKITTSLMSRVIRQPSRTKKGFKKYNWVSRCSYIAKEDPENQMGCAYLEIRLHNHLKPFLIELKEHFGSLPFTQVARLPSLNSVRIFEVLYFASHSFKKKECYFELEDLKKKIGAEDKYKDFKDFRIQVLDRAQKHCTQKTPLRFSYKEKKHGRKVVGLTFTIRQEGEQMPLKLPASSRIQAYRENPHPDYPLLLRDLRDQGLHITPQIEKYIEEQGVELVRDSLEYALEQLRRSVQPVTNPAGFIVKKIEEQAGLQRQRHRQHQTDQKEKEQTQKRIKKLKEKIQLTRTQAIEKFLYEIYQHLSEKEKNEIDHATKKRMIHSSEEARENKNSDLFNLHRLTYLHEKYREELRHPFEITTFASNHFKKEDPELLEKVLQKIKEEETVRMR